MATTKYIIHKVGTPRLQRGKYGGIAPAGLWWHGTGWGDSENAQVWETDNTCRMPVHNGEWVEIYVNEEVEGE
jgi:hypothetical protein